MQFALLPLSRQVYQSISPALLIQPATDTGKLKQTLLKMAAGLQPGFMEHYIHAVTLHEQVAVIHSTQSCAVNLADKLQDYMAQVNSLPLSKEIQEECNGFYRMLEEQLLGLLTFLQEYYGHQCNQNQRMPQACFLQSQLLFQQWAVHLQKLARENIEPTLYTLLAQTLRHDSLPGISYGKFAYWKHLQQQLLQVRQDKLIELLINHNFNDGEFISYTLEIWEQEANAFEPEHRQAYWAQQLKMLTRMPNGQKIALHTNQPHCRLRLITFVENELTAARSHSAFIITNGQKPELPEPRLFQTNLTMAQLACLIRLLVDAQILTCDNHTALLKNIASSFTTRNCYCFTADSLRQKYYSLDNASLSILKTHLNNMMQQLRNY